MLVESLKPADGTTATVAPTVSSALLSKWQLNKNNTMPARVTGQLAEMVLVVLLRPLFGPLADICAAKAQVRFTPESRHWQCKMECLLRVDFVEESASRSSR
jgi:hypothetical protein